MINYSLPHDLRAEQALIGSLLVDPERMDEVLTEIQTQDFYHEKHQLVFRVLKSLFESGSPFDLIVIAKQFEKIGQLDAVGGAVGLNQFMEAMPHGAHVDYYSRIIREAADRRKLIRACGDASRSAMAESTNLEESLAELTAGINAIEQRTAGSGAVKIADALPAFFSELNSDVASPVSTGFAELDGLLAGGFRPGQLVIVAARPSVGKSALALTLSLNMALAESVVLSFSLEMNLNEMTARYLSSLSGIPYSKIASRQLNEDQESKLHEMANQLGQLNIEIDCSPWRRVNQIGTIGRLVKRKRGLDVLFVDYLTLLKPEDEKATQNQQVAAMSRGLKCIAQDLQVPIICLAQLNRGIEQRDDKRPRLSDLRDSGAIEQDADVVLFLERPAMHDPSLDPQDARLYLAKQRNGQTGHLQLSWHAETMTFR